MLRLPRPSSWLLLPALLVKSTLRLCGSRHSPHLVERIHVERQVVQPSVGSLRHRRVGVTVKWHYRVDEIPHLAVGRVEDMCAILMHVNSLYLLAIEISPNMRTLVDNQAPPPLPFSKTGKRAPNSPAPTIK